MLSILFRCARRPARMTQATARRSSVPWLEPLEDRAVPAVFPVTTLADSGAGSLRQAILDANATPGDDTIPVQVNGAISLAGALPDLNSNLDLQGPGADLPTVRRSTGGTYRIFTV